jgi:hypothetical protein
MQAFARNCRNQCADVKGEAQAAKTVRREYRSSCVKKTRERLAVGEMRDGPSESPCRRRLQTAMSCFGQKPRW